MRFASQALELNSVFPVHYEEHYQAALPHLAPLRNIAEVVRLRALAHLEADRPAEAMQDVKLGLRLGEALKSERFLISALVRISILERTLQPIWEGLANHRWNENQLIELQSALARINVLEDYGPCMRMERAVAIYFIDLFRSGEYRPAGSDNGQAENLHAYASMRHLPGGVFSRNQLAIARLYQERLLHVVDVDNHFVDVKGVKRAINLGQSKGYHPYELFANILVPPVAPAAERFARAQAGLDLALVASVLDQYRLANGQYPETLDLLTPKFMARIPSDVITGRSLRYRLPEGDRFVLYSLGWNERDDGGIPGLVAQKKRSDPKKGDWVWTYPAAPKRAP